MTDPNDKSAAEIPAPSSNTTKPVAQGVSTADASPIAPTMLPPTPPNWLIPALGQEYL